MTSTTASHGAADITPTLRRAVGTKTMGFVERAILGKDDVAALKRLLAQHDPAEIELKRALGALTRSDPSRETAEILGQVLADAKAQPRDRAVAAAYLGQLPGTLAERPLLLALSAATGPLRVEIIKSLGQTGSAKTLKTLQAFDDDASETVRRQLGLAKLAIALRDAEQEVSPEEFDTALGLRWETASSKRLEPAALRSIDAAIGGARYGVALSHELGFEFACGRQIHATLLNASLTRGKLVETFSRRGMIAALIFTQATGPSYYTLRWLLLTRPGKSGIRMALVRPNGDAAFEGYARQDDKGLSFTLRDTGLERTPAEIAGRIGDDDIDWSVQQWRGALRGKQRPQPVRPITRARRAESET